uniref:Lymphocyte antigen 6E-like n=1 Tax=Podarcis muralis TaxID=64176 RepID=A0A670I9N6_PODMU
LGSKKRKRDAKPWRWVWGGTTKLEKSFAASALDLRRSYTWVDLIRPLRRFISSLRLNCCALGSCCKTEPSLGPLFSFFIFATQRKSFRRSSTPEVGSVFAKKDKGKKGSADKTASKMKASFAILLAACLCVQRAGYSSQSITKGCVPVCPQMGVNLGFVATSVSCCSSFLCNINGASSVKTNHLILAAGIAASFFYLFGPRL